MRSIDRRRFLALSGTLAAAGGLPLPTLAAAAGLPERPKPSFLWLNPRHAPISRISAWESRQTPLEVICIGAGGSLIAEEVDRSIPLCTVHFSWVQSEALMARFPDSRFVPFPGIYHSTREYLEAALDFLFATPRYALEQPPRAVIASAFESAEAAALAAQVARLCRPLYDEVITLLASREPASALPRPLDLALADLRRTSDSLSVADEAVVRCTHAPEPGDSEWLHRASYLADAIGRIQAERKSKLVAARVSVNSAFVS
jgi:hypothetical protein